MGCQYCDRLKELRNKRNSLAAVLNKSETVKTYNVACVSQLDSLKTHARNVMESEMVKTDTDILPSLKDDYWTSFQSVLTEISKGLSKIDANIRSTQEQDNAYHEKLRREAEEAAARAAQQAAQAKAMSQR